MDAIAIAFVCIVGGIYSLFMLRDCYRGWPERRADTSRDPPPRQTRRVRPTSPYDWWCQVISGTVFLGVAAALLANSWQDLRQFADDAGNRETFSRSVEVPGMLPVPNFSILRDNTRLERPIWCVNLSNLPATDGDIRALLKQGADIEALVLDRTEVTDESLTQLRRLTRLSMLSLTATLITDSGCKAIAQIASLDELDVSNTAITDEGLACLRKLPHLTSLTLDTTRITNSGCRHLAQIATLETLSLKNTEISDAGIEDLADLSNLRWLGLTGTTVSDSSLKLLRNLYRLEHLALGGTNVTRRGLQDLKDKLPHLTCSWCSTPTF